MNIENPPKGQQFGPIHFAPRDLISESKALGLKLKIVSAGGTYTRPFPKPHANRAEQKQLRRERQVELGWKEGK